MKLRTLIFWPHLAAGVVAGSIILLMSVTGVVLTYERQLIAWSDGHYRSVPPSGTAQRLPVETLLAHVRDAQPKLNPSAITIDAAADAPVAIAAGPRALYFDAYSGRMLGEGNQGTRRFMTSLRAWHRWLAVEGEGRDTARAFTGWSNVLFLFIIASGFYLWLPRRWTWQRLRPVIWFTRGVRGKARDFNWHNAIGLWSAVPLFIIVLTAFPMSFPWANAMVYRMVGEDPPPSGRGGREGGAGRATPALSTDGLDTLWARAEQQVDGWRTITLRFPLSERGPVAFAIDTGDGGQPQRRSTLTLDRATGTVVAHETFSDQSLGRRLRSIARFGHTGEILGLPGQTIAGLVTLGAVFLVWTGLALALRRCRAWLARRSGRADVATDSRRLPAA